jgi:hypothetical protein
MPARDTAAIIASDADKALEVVNVVWLQDHRVLLVAKYPGQMAQASQAIQGEYPDADVEVMDCMKEGCWEADLILLNIEDEEEGTVADLIRDVAIQKPVVRLIADTGAPQMAIRLQQLMVHAKVVVASKDPVTRKIRLTGNDVVTKRRIQNILKCKSGDEGGLFSSH